MRRFILLSLTVLTACQAGGTKPNVQLTRMPHVQHAAIINGTVDAADPSVIELYYFEAYDPSACNGNTTCLKGCYNINTGNQCSSGAGCVCGGGATCTSELIGPHTLVTAGHCTDTSAGGELSGQGGPAMTLCSNVNDIFSLANGTTLSNCNLGVLAIFNNTCTTNDEYSSCEYALISGYPDGGGTGGNFIVVDQLVNPGYSPGIAPPADDNDIGLAHLQATTLENNESEPPILTFNRTGLGNSCVDLGQLKFVGYGITAGNGMVSGVKYTVSHDAAVLDPYHDYEGDPSTIRINTSCSALTVSGEPTCSGDSGGPSFNSAGEIVAVTSLGDQNCQYYGQDSRIDAHASWIDSTMQASAWGSDPLNGPSSSTTSGTSGSSGSSGASGCNSCFDSAQQSGGMCSTQNQTCGGDPACVTLNNCLAGCSTQPCATTCEQTAGTTAVGEIQALTACGCSACATQCVGECPASTTGTSSSGTTSTSGSVSAATNASSNGASGSTGASSGTSTGGSVTGSTSSGTAAGTTGSHPTTTAGAGGTTSSSGSGSSTGVKTGGCSSTGNGGVLASLLPLALLGVSRRRRSA